MTPDDPNAPSWLDDVLDAADETQDIGPVFKPAPPEFKKAGFAPPNSQPGFVPCPKRGSFHAKAVLKQLGGHFDWDEKLWYVPVAQRDKAFAACKEAERRNAELIPDEVATLMQPAETDFGTCWECGGPLGEYPKNAAGAQWAGTTLRLKPGAKPDEAYCGCVERGDSKRRHRPDFRTGTLGRYDW